MNNEKKEFTVPLLSVFDHKEIFTTSGTSWEIGSINLIPDINSDSTE